MSNIIYFTDRTRKEVVQMSFTLARNVNLIPDTVPQSSHYSPVLFAEICSDIIDCSGSFN